MGSLFPLAEFLAHDPSQPGPQTGLGRIARGADLVHITDLADPGEIGAGDPRRRRLVELGGVRTYIAVALRKDGKLLGAIAAYRQEVRPFSDKQIALLQNFAAQAVIAMENARLIDRDARGVGAADRDRRGVAGHQLLARRPRSGVRRDAREGDASLRRRLRHLVVYDGEHFRRRGYAACPQLLPNSCEPARFRSSRDRPLPPSCGRTVRSYPRWPGGRGLPAWRSEPRALIEFGGARTWLTVPLRKDDALLGAITVFRQEVRPFTDKQIALLQNFAAQAVIAMENARLMTETREALEQQTATAEVLQVINSSPGDLAPVFDAMLDRAMRLCGAAFGQLHTYDGEGFPTAALRGLPAAYAEYLAKNPPTDGPGTAPWRIARWRARSPSSRTLQTAKLIGLGMPRGERRSIWAAV